MDNKIEHFTDLDVWKVNHQVVLEIYKIIRDFPASEKYGLTDQIRRAGVSITNNIAEGWGRYHHADRNRFYYQARGSNCEVQNLLIIAHELGYLSEKDFNQLKESVFRGFKVLNGLIRSVKNY
jgi:four helix bundle protein